MPLTPIVARKCRVNRYARTDACPPESGSTHVPTTTLARTHALKIHSSPAFVGRSVTKASVRTHGEAGVQAVIVRHSVSQRLHGTWQRESSRMRAVSVCGWCWGFGCGCSVFVRIFALGRLQSEWLRMCGSAQQIHRRRTMCSRTHARTQRKHTHTHTRTGHLSAHGSRIAACLSSVCRARSAN